MKNQSLLSDHLQLCFSQPFITMQSDITEQSTKKLKQSNSQTQLMQTQIAFTNICFESGQKSSGKEPKAGRIHGRQAIKKIGFGHFASFNKLRKSNRLETTNNTTLKSSIKQSSKKVIDSRAKQLPFEMLESRSIQLDEELAAVLKNKKQNDKMQKSSTQKSAQRLITETVTQAVDEQSLKLIFSVQEKQPKIRDTFSSTLSQRQEREKVKQPDKENGFYKKLKSRLQLQMKKIEDKHSNPTYLLLSGCEVTNASRKNEEKRSLTERSRPNTGLTRTGLQINSSKAYMTDRRPKSSKSRNLQRRELLYMSQQLDEPARKRKYKSMKENKDIPPYQPSTTKTYKYVNQMHKKSSQTITKGELQRERVKEKMLNILVDCDQQAAESVNLQAGFKAFQSFTKRMNKGLKATESLISGHYKQTTEIDISYFA